MDMICWNKDAAGRRALARTAAHTPTTTLPLREEDWETHASRNAKMVGALAFKIS